MLSVHEARSASGAKSLTESDPELRKILRHALVSDKVRALFSSVAETWAREEEAGFERLPKEEELRHFLWRHDFRRREKERPVAHALLNAYEIETGRRLPQARRETIADQMSDVDDRRHYDFFGATSSRSLLQSLAGHFLSLEVSGFLLETKRRVDLVYRRFFPDWKAGHPEEQLDFSLVPRISGQYIPRKDYGPGLRLQIDRAWTHANENEIAPGFLNIPMQRRVSALVILLHEEAHQIFDSVVPDKQRAIPGFTTDYDALTEGFAVVVELLAIDKILAARKELELTEQDVQDMKHWKKGRLSSLRREKSHYTFGTLYFWHRVLKREGEGGLRRVLERLKSLPLADANFLYGSRAKNRARGDELLARTSLDEPPR